MSRRMLLEEWHGIRDRLLAECPELVRLDCMNPFQALAKWRPTVGMSSAELVPWDSLWMARLGLPPALLQARRTCGIRSALRSLMTMPKLELATVWLPEDVFPTYFALANEAQIPCATYGTWPQLNLPLDAKAGDWLVLPLPGAPTGRLPDAALVRQLLDWVGKDRWLFIDSVYHYLEPEIMQLLLPLLQSGRVLLATSLSKSFLLRCMGGMVWVPDEFGSMPEDVPTTEDSTVLANALTSLVDLPARQQAAYRRCWERIIPDLRLMVPEWEFPESGYLATFPCPPDELLKRGFLAIPPEVFGSSRPGWSIITCLHEMEGSLP